MLLVPRGHKRRTHRPVQLAAGPHSVAHLHRPGIAAVGRKVQGRRQVGGPVGNPVAQVFGHRRRVNNLAGVHNPLRIPGALQLPEGVINPVAEHLARPHAPHNPVPVFAAHGAAKLLNQVGHGAADGKHPVNALLPLQADEGPDVQTAHGGVSIVAGRSAVVGDDFVKAAHKLAHHRRVHGGILDKGNGLGVALDAHQQPQTALADTPHGGLPFPVQDVHAGVGRPDVRLQAVHFGRQLVLRFPVKLRQQHGAGVALNERQQAGLPQRLPAAVQHHLVNQLNRRRIVPQHAGGGLAGLKNAAEMQRRQRRHPGARHQIHFGLGHHAQRTLRTHHHAGQVDRPPAASLVPDGIVPDELVQVVAADPPLDFGVGTIDLIPLLPGNPQRPPVDVPLQPPGAQPRFQPGSVQSPEMRRRPVRQDDIQLLDMIQRLAVDDRMGAAGVVPDAAAHAGPVGRSRVGGVL